jgi:hypothetical protein
MQELLTALKGLGLKHEAEAEHIIAAWLNARCQVCKTAIRWKEEAGRRERGKLIREKAKLKRKVLEKVDTWHKVACPVCGAEFKVNSFGKRWDEVHARTPPERKRRNSNNRQARINRRGWMPW